MLSKFEKNRIAIAIATQVSQSHRNRKVRNRNRKYKNRKINVEIAIAKNQRCDAIGTPDPGLGMLISVLLGHMEN